jgi:hypothetical protein
MIGQQIGRYCARSEAVVITRELPGPQTQYYDISVTWKCIAPWLLVLAILRQCLPKALNLSIKSTLTKVMWTIRTAAAEVCFGP